MTDWRRPFVAIWQARSGEVITAEPLMHGYGRVCIWPYEGAMCARYSNRTETMAAALDECEALAELADARPVVHPRLELRVRIWVAGQLQVDEPLRGGPEVVLSQHRHRQLIDTADALGQTWLLEVSDPWNDIAPLRFGTDEAGMVEPIDVDALGGWARALARVVDQRERGEEHLQP